MENPIYKNILLVGANGSLGKHILGSLLADKTFNVTVLSRTNSTASFASNVKVIKIDYSDEQALVTALNGQDVVISAIGGEGLSTNFDSTLLKAALRSGVKWFIPSEFGIDTSHPAAQNNPVFAPKIAVAKLLKENEANIAHTAIITGVFLDWGFDNGFLGFDIDHRSATLFDEGKNRVSGTTLANIGQAVVSILRNPAMAKNKRIYVADVTFTQQQVLEFFQKHTETQWTITNVSTSSLLEQAGEAFSKGDTMTGVVCFLRNIIYGGQGASEFDTKISNADLGLKAISLEEIIGQVLKKKEER